MSSIDSEIAKFKNIKFARSLKSAKKGEYVCCRYPDDIGRIDHCDKRYLFVRGNCFLRQTGIEVGNPTSYLTQEIFCIDKEFQEYHIEKETNRMKTNFIRENIHRGSSELINQIYNLIKQV